MSETSFTWGTVTGVLPLRVQLDGDTAALPITPDSLVDPMSLTAGQRVRCELSDRRLLVHGTAKGSSVPTGNVDWTVRSTAPAGWLLLNGAAVSRTTYADIFAIIGTTYGAGDGSTTFNLPNVAGKTIVGRDAGQTEFATLGQAGGAKTHTLSTAEIPSHQHNGGSNLTRTTGGGSDQTGTGIPPHNGSPSGNQDVKTTLQGATGGGGSHNNLQPYLVLNAIIKT